MHMMGKTEGFFVKALRSERVGEEPIQEFDLLLPFVPFVGLEIEHQGKVYKVEHLRWHADHIQFIINIVG
jgi:hypothetical protein